MPLPPRHVLACTDFSEASHAAARRAAWLARRHGARLTLLSVVPASPLRDAVDFLADHYFPADRDRFDPARVERAMSERLEDEAVRLGQEEAIACEAVLKVGRPAAAIAAAARELGADLLVAGQHGSHAFASTVVGTTTQKLLRLSPCPVLVVKQAPPFDYGTVLLPTDLSEPSLGALRATAALLPSATFHVAHAFELPYEGLLNYANVGDEALAHYVGAEQKRMRPQLAEFVQRAGFPHTRVALHLEHGYPSREIDGWIARLNPDLVALAAHGKGEIERMFLGSVSLHVVLSSPRDVLLLRQDETA